MAVKEIEFQRQFDRIGVKLGYRKLDSELASLKLDNKMKAIAEAQFPPHTVHFKTTERVANFESIDDFNFLKPHKLSECPYDDGGNNFQFISIGLINAAYYVCINASDPSPENPEIYILDHYDPEQRPYSKIQFLEFLNLLQFKHETN